MSGFELALSDVNAKKCKIPKTQKSKARHAECRRAFVYLQLKHSIAEDDGDGRHLSEVQAQSVVLHHVLVHYFGL